MAKSTNLYVSAVNQPLDISILTEEEFYTEIEKGYDDVEKHNVFPAKEAFTSLRDELGI